MGGKAVDVVCLDFGRAFQAVSYNVPIEKLRRYRLDWDAVGWIHSGLICHEQWVVIDGSVFG